VEEEEVRVFDLEGGYVLPGLWAVHTHVGAIFPDAKRLTFRESTADRTIRAGRNTMDALRVGITGIRVVGEQDYIDVAWKRAFDTGVFVGPRLFVCGNAIIATGGHGHGLAGCLEVDGPYDMRKAVREQLKHGVDQIKLIVSGGHGDMIRTGVAESMQVANTLQDEVEAAVEVAHQKGKRVCVHAWGAAGIKTAIRGGVDCIEHGLLDDEAIAMMLENDVYYVPTIRCTQNEEFWRKSGVFEFQIKKFREGAKAHVEGFQKALKAGLKIACGSDASAAGEYGLDEIEHLVRAGMTEMEALIAATQTSADLCGVADQLGTIEVGKLADLIAVSANPLEDISNVRELELVLKGGKWVDTKEPEGLADFWQLFF